MKLISEELRFIEKRERLAASWTFVGALVLALFFAFAIWAWLNVPQLINPWMVVSNLKAGNLPETTVSLMAAMLPVVMLTLLVSAGLVVGLVFCAFSNERRLIRIIRKLEENGAVNEV